MHTREYVTKRGRRADYVAKQGRRASIEHMLEIDGKAVTRPPCFLFFAPKKKARQLENKAGTKGAKCGGNVWEIRWPGCSAADNETCATFRRHSRRQGTEQSMQENMG